MVTILLLVFATINWIQWPQCKDIFNIAFNIFTEQTNWLKIYDQKGVVCNLSRLSCNIPL